MLYRPKTFAFQYENHHTKKQDPSDTLTCFIIYVIQPYVFRYLVDKIHSHYAGNYNGAIMF